MYYYNMKKENIQLGIGLLKYCVESSNMNMKNKRNKNKNDVVIRFEKRKER